MATAEDRGLEVRSKEGETHQAALILGERPVDHGVTQAIALNQTMGDSKRLDQGRITAGGGAVT